MPGINKVILIGHIGKAPELRFLPGNVVVLDFPFATKDQIMKHGVRIEQTEWHNIVLLTGLAEAAHKVLAPGKLVYLEGKLRTRSFIDEQRVKRYLTEVIVDHFVVLGRASDFEPAG